MAAPIRINKYLADRGLATRRGADELVRRGAVRINGTRASLGDRVSQGDTVELAAGSAAPEKPHAYYACFKKAGIETLPSSKGGASLFGMVSLPEKVFPVGRLDKDSEGLIILTNDGRITGRLLSPGSGHEKEYSVVVDKPVTDLFLRRLRDGVVIGRGEKTRKARVRRTGKDSFDIAITEGKNRQIRRMCAAFGYNVKKLKRFRIMNIELGRSKPGTVRKIEGKELAEFLKLLSL